MDPIQITILSREPESYSTRRLQEAATAAGHAVRVCDTLKFALHVESDEPDMSYRGEPLGPVDVVIPRIGSSVAYYGTSVVRQFEQMGAFCLNGSSAISFARDKLRSMQILSRHDIGIPSTAFVVDRRDVLPAIERVGGAPVILKLLEGTQGVGVILADSIKIAEAIIETLQSTRQNVLIQKFVAESKGRDIRAFVIGDRVVAAMRRQAVGHEFRSNVHRGGMVSPVELDETYERCAVRAAQILGLRVAGVDILESSEGPLVMEVNASPGLEGIERATSVDIAGEIIKYIEEHVRFGDLDIRQRLSLARGYAVTEFHVPPTSGLANRLIRDSGLRERDIIILRITRGAIHMPIPQGDTQILPADVLLCYGNQQALRDYLPTLESRRKERTQRRKKS